MKRIITFLAIGLALHLISCTSEKVKPEMISADDLAELTLPIDTIGFFPGYDAPKLYLIEDTIALFIDPKEAGYLRFFSFKHQYLKSYFLLHREGIIRLPLEPQIDSTSLELYNEASDILFKYAVKKNIFHIVRMTRMNFTDVYTPAKAVRVDKTQIACIGPYNGLWGLFDEEKRVFRNFGNYPIEMEHLPSYCYEHLNGEISKYDNQLVYASNKFGYITSYTYKNKKMKKLWEKQLSPYLYEDKGSRLVFHPDHRSGFRDVYISPDYIYAVYDGYSQSKDETGERHNYLLQFDHDGRLLARYSFPFEINHITMDSEYKYIYTTCSSGNKENHLVRFLAPKQKI